MLVKVISQPPSLQTEELKIVLESVPRRQVVLPRAQEMGIH